jgi:hypothetical protein
MVSLQKTAKSSGGDHDQTVEQEDHSNQLSGAVYQKDIAFTLGVHAETISRAFHTSY